MNELVRSDLESEYDDDCKILKNWFDISASSAP